MDIDYSFLEAREGKSLKGYVPHDKEGNVIGHSGVTIATGFDLGQLSARNIQMLPIPAPVKAKLTPYAGLIGQAAVTYLLHHPLEVDEWTANLLDTIIEQRHITELKNRYNLVSRFDFEELPRAVQTALASLMMNFGRQLFGFTETWGYAVAGEWQKLAEHLENFPSKQPELSARRKLEAELIRKVV